jgi:tetratricopeptide (TPR) repeat protein
MTAPASTDLSIRRVRDLVATCRWTELLDVYRCLDSAASCLPEVQLCAATAATRLGQMDLAASLASEALERFRMRSDSDGRLRAVNLLGAISFERGRLADAEGCFAEAQRLAEQSTDDLLAARAANNLASVAALRGSADEAVSLYRRALLAYQRLGDRRGIAETHHNLGLTFREMGKFIEAEAAITEAVRHAELAADASLIALALTGRAEIELARGHPPMAAQALDRAAQLALEADDDLGAAEVRRLRAMLALAASDATTARDEAERAYEVAVRCGGALLRGECAAVLSLALRALGRTLEAEGRRDEAVTVFRSLGASRLAEALLARWEESAAGTPDSR